MGTGIPETPTAPRWIWHPVPRRMLTDLLPCALSSYGMRYVAKTLRASLAEKFPKASEEELDKVPGGCAATWASQHPWGCGRGISLQDVPQLPFPSMG